MVRYCLMNWWGNMICTQLPATFNLPKSQLQGYGEWIYSTNEDLITKCNKGESPLERLINVLAWSISTIRPCLYGAAPYNPILGETHHVSSSSLNVLLEQVWYNTSSSGLPLNVCAFYIKKFLGKLIWDPSQGN